MRKFFFYLIFFSAICSGQTAYNVTLFGKMNKYGSNPGASNYSEIWGWTDSSTSKEYAIIGTPGGTSIVNVTTAPLIEVSFLKGPPSSYNYHEFRTYKNYLYIGAEGTDLSKNAGIQIVDLSSLPDSASFKKVFVWKDTNATNGTIRDYYRAHTVSIDKHFLYVNGGDFGGTRIMDISDPLNPGQAGSYGKGSTPYVHDAYIRNDTLYAAAIGVGRLDIVDFTTKGHYTHNTTSKVISKTTTVPEGRTHQVWLSEDGRYAFVATEAAGTAFTYNLHIYDITQKSNPVQIATWTSDPAKSIHNVFVKGNYLYIAYYTDGFRVLDISNPTTPIEVAFYQTYNGTSSNPPIFAGAWGVYPYFPSGKVAVSDMNTGLYVFNVDEKKGGRVTGTVTDAATGAAISGVTVTIEQTGRKQVTDGSGNYLYGTAEGMHTIHFSKAGFYTRTEYITTKAGSIDTVDITLSPGVAAIHERQPSMAENFTLNQNYPNPFNPTTHISFTLERTNRTLLTVANALGQELVRIIDQTMHAGVYTIQFNGHTLPSGVYFYTLQSGNQRSTMRMLLAK